MSVIGYDGKIRPKSVAVNYKPQGTMSPEQMERIHAAKPDYVSGVMKMFDSFNANMTDTIGYFDKARKEREAVEHEEEKFRSGQELSAILDNPDSTPDEKQKAVDKHNAAIAAKYPVGKGNATDRGRALEFAAQGESATRQVRAQANRQKKEAEALGRDEEKLAVKQKAYEVSLSPDMPLDAKLDELYRIESGFSTAGNGDVAAQRHLLELKGIVQGRVNYLKEKEIRDKEVIHAAELDVKGRDLVSNLNKGFSQFVQIKINENPDMVLDDIPALVDEYFDQVVGNARDGLDEKDLAKFNVVASSWKGSAVFKFGEALSAYKDAKTKDNIYKASASAAASSDDVISACIRSYSAVEEYTQKGMVDKAEQVKAGVSTSIAWMGNAARKTLEDYNRADAEIKESYNSWESEFGVEKADAMAAERYKKARQGVKDAIEAVKRDSERLYDFVSGGGLGVNLSKLEKDFYKDSIDEGANKIILELEKSLEQKQVVAKATAKKAKEEVGVNRFVGIQKFLREESGDLPQDAVPLFMKLERNAKYLAEWDARLIEQGFTPEVRAKMLEEFITNRYSHLEKGDQVNAAVDDFINAIVGLNMSDKGEQNALDIESLLDSAARLFGPNSDEYKKIALFAYNNIRKEKNGMGNEAIAVVNDALLDGNTPSSKEGREMLSANPALSSWYYKTVQLLQEIPYEGDEWRQKAEEIKVMVRKRKAFMSIVSAAGFEEGVKAARKTVDDRAKAGPQATSAQAVNVKKQWEVVTDKNMAAFDEEAAEVGATAVAEYYEAHPDASYGQLRRKKNEAISDYWYGKAKEIASGFDALRVRIGQTRYADENIRKNRAAVRDELLYQNKNRFSHAAYNKSYVDRHSAVMSEIKEAGLEDEFRTAVGPAKSAFGSYDEMEREIKIGRKVLEDARKNKVRAQKEEEGKKALIEEAESTIAKRNTRKFFKEVSAGEKTVEANGKRTDGTTKGDGWFGRIDLGGKKFATEISITTEVDGVSVDIPLLNPLCTKKDIDVLIRLEKVGEDKLSKEDKKALEGIYEKAHEWAKQRWDKKLSPYIMKGENVLPLPKDEEDGEKK